MAGANIGNIRASMPAFARPVAPYFVANCPVSAP